MLNLTNEIYLRSEKTVASNLSIYYTWKNIKSSYNNNIFKISGSTRSEEFELPDGSYSASDIQDYFKYILKKHSENVNNPPIIICVNKIENRITFKIKFVSLLEISPPNHVFLKTFNSEFREIKVWFTDQKSRTLEKEDKINVTLIIK